MIEKIHEYNSSLKEDGDDKGSFSFKIDTKENRKNQAKEFAERIQSGLKLLSTVVSNGTAKNVAPLQMHEFDGINEKMSVMDEEPKHDTITIVGFPFRVGVISYKVRDHIFYNIGVKVTKVKSS